MATVKTKVQAKLYFTFTCSPHPPLRYKEYEKQIIQFLQSVSQNVIHGSIQQKKTEKNHGILETYQCCGLVFRVCELRLVWGIWRWRMRGADTASIQYFADVCVI